MGAYEEGRASSVRGDSDELNPYDESDAQWDAWDDGWWDGVIEDNL